MRGFLSVCLQLSPFLESLAVSRIFSKFEEILYNLTKKE